MKRSLSLLLAVAILLSLVYAGPVAPADAASASGYIFSTYAAFLSVKTTKAVSLREGPSTEAKAAYSVAKDTMLTVKALHKNTSGSYWYEVLYYNLTLYMEATAATLVDHLTGDVKATDLMTPAALGYGQGFPISGTVSTTYNKLGKITAAVYYKSNIHKDPAIASSDTVSGSSYSLKGSTVDNNMIYSDLATGSYTHMLTVEAISYYINSSGALATSTQTVVLDNKPLVVTQANTTNPIVAKGIDVSVHQGSINWAAVASEIDFAILRIGWETTLDTRFAENAAGCNANGIPFGVYIYSYAESEAEAIAEANFVISALKNYDVDLPIFFDIEDECQAVLGATAIQNIVKAFCDTIRDAGYQPGLYTFLSWFNSYFGDYYYNSLPKWVAQVDVNSCSYGKGLTMWQYSWKGSFSGISGDVDCNYYFGEFPGISSDTSYLSKCTYYPANQDATITATAELRQYPSSDHTLLDTLSAGTKVHVTGLYKNAYGNYWYQVEKDGVTGYIFHDNLSVEQFRYDDLSVVDPKMDNIALNSGYYLKGWLHSIYNNLDKVHARIYSGEDTTVAPALSSSAAANAKKYTLNYSDVCDGLHFNKLAAGYYTYEISADVKNYYVAADGSLASKDENVVVWTKPFTVGGASIVPPASSGCQHNTVTQPAVAPTCTATGLTEGSYCSACGEVFAEQTQIPALGHSYDSKVLPANCKEYERVQYTCSSCGDSYSVYTGQGDWVETLPEGVDLSKVETKTQYRYSDYETKTSNAASLSGYTQIGKKWIKKTSGTVQYVESWHAGFDTSHSLYASYNNKAYTAGETATTKTEVSRTLYGHIMWHWCSGMYSDGPYNRTTSQTKNSTHNTFHAFAAALETVNPETLTHASDGSVTYPHLAACGDSWWWYYTPVYRQSYTIYEAEFTYERWSDWSAWSDTPVSATTTRKVETRTMYRYLTGELGDHSYVDGVCSVCGEIFICSHTSHNVSGICSYCGKSVNHTYVDGKCQICGKSQNIKKILPNGAALSFKDEVLMKIYFSVEGLGDVPLTDFGLLTWNVAQVNGTIATAQNVISGATDAGDGRYWVCTDGIPAKKLGDVIYFKVYAKLADGTYVYSSLLTTSPKKYAMNKINDSDDPELKALCVALLNYGAAAQNYFGYKPYSLANADLTEEQKALVQEYDPAMVADVPALEAEKIQNFVRDPEGFSLLGASVNFGSAYAINFYFAPAKEVDGEMTLHYWSPYYVGGLDKLTVENSTGYMSMVWREGAYWGDLSGLSARMINLPGYMAAVYESDGVTYTTGILPISVGMYCKSVAEQSAGSEARELAQYTAVYGYYADIYFN